MKKRFILIESAIVLLIISGALFIHKTSYAEPTLVGDACFPSIQSVYFSKETVSYIKNGKNAIVLPKEVIGYADADEVISTPVITTNVYDLYGHQHDYRYDFRSYQYSLEFGYLIDNKFSANMATDNYYKQILLLWAFDRFLEYDDNFNYTYDEILDKEESYDDKFDYEWRFLNRLSAGDKAMLLESSYGKQMISILDGWENYISWIQEDNKAVELDSIDSSSISYYVTNDYIETKLITPTSTGKAYSDKFSGYEVFVPSYVTVLNSKGEEQTKFSSGESFKVRIPIDKVKQDSLDFTINIEGIFKLPMAITYSKEDERNTVDDYSDYLYNLFERAYIPTQCITYEEENTSININIHQGVGDLKVKVVDSSTGNNLSKAEVAIFDMKGNEVYRYETTDKELNITLPVGDYIVKQTITPPNYEATTVQMKVSVSEEKMVDAVLENVPLVDVPDTGKDMRLFTSFGLVTILLGLLLIAGIVYKREQN